MCNTLSTMYYPTNTRGVFKIKDPIGSIWSGIAVNVAVDGKRYKIFYGCPKMPAIDDRCDDPFLNIYTRMPKPDPLTLAEIDSILRKAFGFSLASLPRTFHGRRFVWGVAVDFKRYKIKIR
ncbi:uncharacterized protein LOC132752427 [Ruditapes philippinarum]|uniref:uncharacterized protein LOC132752427 n=1 Tax=Ruditapes philippinarum TaxID=129788 RepID=UPI00295AC1C9|nr:uncharacterized protein LOC132752427 [Ruditapes philippinarum]